MLVVVIRIFRGICKSGRATRLKRDNCRGYYGPCRVEISWFHFSSNVDMRLSDDYLNLIKFPRSRLGVLESSEGFASRRGYSKDGTES